MSSLKSHLAKARGLGSAGSGTEIWFTQRVTWLATIILSFLVLILLVTQAGNGFEEVRASLAGFWPTLLLILFVAVTFYHYSLELQEVIEDYVHNRVLELSLLMGVRFGFAIIGVAAILMILRNFFGI